MTREWEDLVREILSGTGEGTADGPGSPTATNRIILSKIAPVFARTVHGVATARWSQYCTHQMKEGS